MPYSCFISDLHLDEARPDIDRAFSYFLSQHTSCEALYILGDLFEAWIGDDDDAPLARETRQKLRAFTASGPALYLQTGNRDFLLGEAFCRDTGATLLADEALVELYGTRTLLLHGDTLCSGDRDYQALRLQLRDPRWQADFLALSLGERRSRARALRNLSRESVQAKDESIVDASPEAVSAALRNHSVSRLIHGHTHRPGHHRLREGERWVLGDWDTQGWWLSISPEKTELNNFIIQ